MAIRIEGKSIRLTPTLDPNIMQVEADVTREGAGSKNPKMEHVTIKWNKNTPKDGIKEAMEAALNKKNTGSLADEITALIGETVTQESADEGKDQPIIIKAESVTIEAKSIIINEVK